MDKSLKDAIDAYNEKKFNKSISILKKILLSYPNNIDALYIF